LRYLVDTDCVIDWLNDIHETVETLRTLSPEGLGISLITYGEVYEGVYFGRNPDQAERGFLRFLRIADVVALDEGVMRVFARLRGELRRQRQTVGDGDILIAASAIYNDLDVVTRNQRDFARIPGLRLYQPA